MFELLISADAFVPDHGAAVKQAAAELGIRALDESKFTRNPHQRVEFSFSRVNRDRRVAPTMLEFISELDPGPGWQPDEDYDSVPEIGAAQGDRPARLHSTVVGVGDNDVYTLAERLARLGVAHRLSMPGDHYPIPRLWVGYRMDQPGVHDPEADGGTWLEFIPTSVFGYPEPGATDAVEVAEGSVVRIIARTILVSDLADTVSRYEKHFGWMPSSGPRQGADGILRARWEPSYPNGAALEVVEPGSSAEGYEAGFAREHGPGPCSIRFAVCGLAALRERLRALGVGTFEAPELDRGFPRLIRPADFGLGTAFEFVEWDGA